LLGQFAADERNEIVIISGRPMEVLEGWFGALPVNLVAEHGSFYKKKGEDWLQSIPVNASWKATVMQTMESFAERCRGAFVEEKMLALAWHYRNAEKELGFLRSRELINALAELSSHLNFDIIEGNKVIEARARGIDKGLAANTWISQKSWDFILAAGDDRTDEDLFRVVPGQQYTIRVGLTQSTAKYNLKKQSDLILLLKKLLSCAVII
jgi:trehalose 6-phosphate synthase/phosphatase